MAESMGNYHLKMQKSFDTCLEMASYLLKIAKDRVSSSDLCSYIEATAGRKTN